MRQSLIDHLTESIWKSYTTRKTEEGEFQVVFAIDAVDALVEWLRANSASLYADGGWGMDSTYYAEPFADLLEAP